MTYRQLAKLYDFLMKDAPYDQWTSFTEQFINQKKPANQISILDLGCGTGQVTWRLAEKGYQVTGVDLSEDMLTEASALANEKNLHVQWLQQDITELEGLYDYDVIVSYCDVINYITDPDKLMQGFQRIYDSLDQSGVFLFDVHSMNHVKNEMVDQLFSEVYDDLSYIWFCYPGEFEGEMTHELTFFIKDSDQYQRFDEFHHQRTYPISTYLTMLKEVGFKEIKVFADFQFDEEIIEPFDESEGDRFFFACRK